MIVTPVGSRPDLPVSRATAEDLPGLVALETSFPVDQRWSEESWAGELVADNRHVTVCRDDEGSILAAATFAVVADVVDLHRVVTLSTERRLGLARTLVDEGILWASAAGAARMLLEVESSNTAALALYDAAGFRRISERRNYYGPGAHAVIMERELLPREEPR